MSTDEIFNNQNLITQHSFYLLDLADKSVTHSVCFISAVSSRSLIDYSS